MVNLREFDVPQKLQIDEGVVERWLMMMESNYLERNPYHNSTHAADVLAVSKRIARTVITGCYTLDRFLWGFMGQWGIYIIFGKCILLYIHINLLWWYLKLIDRNKLCLLLKIRQTIKNYTIITQINVTSSI